jgi:hypothetical protein
LQTVLLHGGLTFFLTSYPPITVGIPSEAIQPADNQQGRSDWKQRHQDTEHCTCQAKERSPESGAGHGTTELEGRPH